MPMHKSGRDFLIPFAENSSEILQEFLDNKQKMSFASFNIPQQIGWKLFSVYDCRGVRKNSNYMPTLQNLLDNLPENITLSQVLISVVPANTQSVFHTEVFPHGFRRFHIPLVVDNNSFLEIENEGKFYWEVGETYLFENPQDRHRVVHKFNPAGNSDRIVILLDVYEDVIPTKEDIAASFDVGKNNYTIMDDD